MRKSFLVGALLAGLAAPAAAKDHTFHMDNSIPLHVVGGYAVSKYVTKKTGNPWKGCLAAFAVGIAKEAYDRHTGSGRVQGSDVAATVAGCMFTFRF